MYYNANTIPKVNKFIGGIKKSSKIDASTHTNLTFAKFKQGGFCNDSFF